MQFRVLGCFEVISDTGERVPVTRPPARWAIFAPVSYRNESVPAERLIDRTDGYQATGHHGEAVAALNDSITAFARPGSNRQENEARKALAAYRQAQERLEPRPVEYDAEPGSYVPGRYEERTDMNRESGR